jgi:hypothetical protein
MRNAQTIEQGGGSPVEPARLGLRLECGIFGESRTIGWRENNNTS